MNSQTEILESQGEAMDRMYRFQRHIYDVSRRYYLLGRDRLLDELQPPQGGSVLEIGCGTGRNLVGAARRYGHAKLFGIDISQEMLRSALTKMRRSAPGTGVKFACVDATSFDTALSLGQAKFDRIYFSYTLSMIPQWQAALAHAHSLLAPAGELHIVDFGQCENIPPRFRTLLFRWLAAFHVSPRVDLKAVLTQLASQTGSQVHFKSCYRGYSWLASIKLQAASQAPDL
jgi:S-adenosylmethionine-diacylgycerolhomoserine-N-methlytransferase